jgi:uncharacterized YkwD family protein
LKRLYLFIAVFIIVLSLLYLNDFINPNTDLNNSKNVVVLENDAILREGSSENDDILATLEKGEKVEIISKGDKWSTIYIPSKDLKGSILTNQLTTDNDSKLAINEPEEEDDINSDLGFIDVPESIDSISSIETIPVKTEETTETHSPTKEQTEEPSSTPKNEETVTSDNSNEELPEGMSEDDKILLDLVNEAREEVGAGKLEFDLETAEVAQIKAEDMNENNYFDHTSPTYGSPFDMLTQFGVTYMTAGENIAAGQSSVETAHTAWMNSEGHRENIENPSFTMVGFGIAPHPKYNVCYVQMFIGK